MWDEGFCEGVRVDGVVGIGVDGRMRELLLLRLLLLLLRMLMDALETRPCIHNGVEQQHFIAG